MLRDSLLERALRDIQERELARFAADVVEHRTDPYSLVKMIVDSVLAGM